MTTVAIVTGAASGIGAACARRLAETVDVLLLGDIDETAVTAKAAEIADAGTTCEPVVVDLTDAAGSTTDRRTRAGDGRAAQCRPRRRDLADDG